MKRNLLLLTFLLCILTSCEFKCSAGNSGTGTSGDSSNTAGNSSEPSISNDIQLKTTGDVKVSKAFLSDDAGAVKQENVTSVNLPLNINLTVSGWKEENGKVFFGASEVVTTSDGIEVLNTGDQAAPFEASGMDAINSKEITLKAVVSDTAAVSDFYIVNFRLWDKKGNGEITGSYKFTVK